MSRREMRILAAVAGACIGVAVWLSVRFLTSPAFVTPRLEGELSRLLDTQCCLEGVQVKILGESGVGALRVYHPGRKGAGVGPFIRLEGIRVVHNPLALLKGKFQVDRVRVRSMDLNVTPEELRWLSALQERHPPGKEPVRLPAIQIEGGTVRVDVPRWGEAFSAEHVSCRLAQDEAGRLRGTIGFEINGNPFCVDIEKAGAGAETSLHVRMPGVRLERLPLPYVKGASSFLEGLALSGQARGDLRVHLSGVAGEKPFFEGEVALSGLNVSRSGWPAAIEGVAGECHFAGGKVWLDEVTGHVAGAQFRIESAQVGLRGGGGLGIAARGQVRGLDVSQLVEAELPAAIAEQLDESGLRAGRADIAFDIVKEPGGEPAFEVAVSLKDGSLRPGIVPVSLEDVRFRGRYYSDGRVEITHARALVDGGVVEVKGQVQLPPGGRAVPELDISFTGIPIKDEIVQHLPEQVQQISRAVGLEGGELDGKLALNPQGMVFEARFSAQGMSSPLLPYSLKDLSSEVRWSSVSGKAQVRDFKARHGKGLVRGSGTINLGERPTLDLLLEGRELPIDEELQQLLPAGVRQLWQQWEPAGDFDISVRVRERELAGDTAAGPPLAGIDACVHLRDLSVTHKGAAVKIRRLAGDVSAHENAVTITGLTGEVGGVQFEANGFIGTGGGQPGILLLARTARTRLTPELVEQLPQVIAQQVLRLHMEGEFEAQVQLRRLALKQQEPAASLTLMLHDIGLRVGEVPVRTTGTVRVSSDNPLSECFPLRCAVRLQRLRAGSLYGSDLVANLDIAGDRLYAARIDMDAFGGTLEMEDATCKLPQVDWQLKGRISHLDLESMMAALGIEGREAPAGMLRGKIELAGRRDSLSALKGQGELKIDRGQLYNLPIILSVLNLFDLRLPSESPVSEAYAAFYVEDGTFYLDDALLVGGTIPVHIRGTIGLKDGVPPQEQAIDLIFSVVGKKGVLDRIPLVNIVKRLTVDQLRKYVFQARAVGTFSDYELKSIPKLLTAPISGLWHLLGTLYPGGDGEQEE